MVGYVGRLESVEAFGRRPVEIVLAKPGVFLIIIIGAHVDEYCQRVGSGNGHSAVADGYLATLRQKPYAAAEANSALAVHVELHLAGKPQPV